MKRFSSLIQILLAVSVGAFFTLTDAAARREDLETIFSARRQLQFQADEYPTCGDCWCINGDEPCLEPAPRTDYSDLIPKYKALELTSPIYTLDCDPYNDADCQTDPPLEEGGACVLAFEGTDPCPDSYGFFTYEGTFEEAEADPDIAPFITHSGACGTCSTAQDFAVYVETGPDLTDEATKCGLAGLADPTRGIDCFINLGFTDACAAIWFYNTVNTSQKCIDICLPFITSGNSTNGDPPECVLADCIECDEVMSGPIFQLYAGRTRRNSYLRANIVRPCDVYNPITHFDPCPDTPPTDAPTPSPTPSSSAWSRLELSPLTISTASAWLVWRFVR